MPGFDDQVIRFGLFELDAAAGELRKAGRRLKLAPQPWRILEYLAERPGRLVSRDEIVRHVWGGEVSVDFDAGLATALRRIRSVLGDDSSSPRFVETVPRRGYRFIAPVTIVTSGKHPPEAAAPRSVQAPPSPSPGAAQGPPALSGEGPSSGGRGSLRRRALRLLTAAGIILLALAGMDVIRESGGPARATGGPGSPSPEAVDLYHRGRFVLDQGGPAEAGRAVEYFRQAVEIEPAYAQARVSLAEALRVNPRLPLAERLESALRQVELALRLEDPPPGAWALRARLRWMLERDWKGAQLDYREALAREPGSAAFHQDYALLLTGMGEHRRAIEEMETARRLDPLSPALNLDAAWVYFYARDYHEAIRLSERAAELSPSFLPAHVCAGYAWGMLGEEAKSWASFRRAMASAGAGEDELERMDAAAAEEKRQHSKEWWTTEERVESRVLPAFDHALIRLREGDREGAFRLLQESIRLREGASLMLAVDPRLDPVRETAGFRDLLVKINRAG